MPPPPPRSSSPSGIASSPSGIRSSPMSSSPSGVRSAPGFQSSPSVVARMAGGPRTTQKRTLDVDQWLRGVRRALEPFRQYAPEHATALEAVQRCITGVLELTAQGELQLDVGHAALQLDGQPLQFSGQGAVDKTRDPLAVALFNEGIRRLTFLPALSAAEAMALLLAWLEAANHPLCGNIASKVWEQEPKGLKLVLLDTFDGPNEGSDGTGLSAAVSSGRKALSVADQIDSLVSAISAEGLAADGGGGFVSHGLMQVSADDLALLRSDAVRGITAAQLAAHEQVGAASFTALDDATAKAMRDELEAERSDALTRLGPTLLNAAVLNAESDWGLVGGAFSDLVRGAIRAGEYALPLQVFQHLVAGARADATLGARRVEVLKQWKSLLLEQPVLDSLVQGLDTDAGRDKTLAALKVLGKAAIPAALRFVSATKSEPGREAALGFVRSVDPSQVASSTDGTLDETNLGLLVARLAAMPDADARELLERLLSSPEVQSRRIGAMAVTPNLAPLLRHTLVLARLQDNDVEVRLSMLRIVLALEDPSALPALRSLAHRPRIDSPELELLFETIAVVGGAEAVDLLEHELRDGAPARRSAAALALGASTRPEARALLRATAGKLLTLPGLRAACRTALERHPRRASHE